MDKTLLPEAEQYTRQNRLRQIWRKFVRVMACVVVFCTTYALILPAITMEKDPVCGLEEHTHAESCYTQVTTVRSTSLACTYDSLGVHAHEAECYDAEGALVCGLSDYVLHTHDDSCAGACTLPEISGHVHADGCWQAAEPVLVCGLEETDAHAHADGCYDAEGALVCTLAETGGHAHGEGCWQTPDPALVCGREEAILHSHAAECYDAEGVLTCTQPVLEQHIHGEGCFTVTEEAADTESLTCGQEESEAHTHTAQCYGTWELTCGMEEHTHIEECYPAEETSEAPTEPNAVEQVIALIDEMPSADEIDAKIEEFEEAEDYEGEEAWLTEVYQQVAYVYSQYSALTEEEKAQVTNADKLLELEYIWSVTTLADYTRTVHWVDYYNYDEGKTVGRETSTVVFASEPVDSYGYYYWTGFVIEREGAHFRVKEILPYETNKTGRTPSATGYIVMIFSNVSSSAAVGDYIDFKNFYPDHHYGLSVSGYGSVVFSKTPMVASQAPVVENYASTSAFVNLNLYDYHGDINTNGYTDINTRFLAGNTEYPGFQWNGGAYPYRYRYGKDVAVPNPERDWIASRYYVDTLDFGNSYITDYGLDAYFTSTFDSLATAPWYKGYKTSGSVSVAKTDPGDDLINGIVYGDMYGRHSNTDHPIGVSTKYKSIGNMLAYDVNGYYPQLGYAASSHGESLRYLFDETHPGHYADKKNTQNIDGLFQKNEVTGEYYYDSRENHAQFDAATSKFVLYKQVITPNYILYPFGNFLPLNDITDPEGTTQVSAFDYQGGVKSYFESVMKEIQSKSNLTNSEIQLYRMLLSYRYNWENWVNPKRSTGRLWPTITAADTLNDYFDNSSEFSDEGADFYRTDLQKLLTKVYNIDYNIPKNFFFGMDMSMHFMQPKDGLTGNDTNQDGTPDYPMVFYFAGDDDVWAYIDNILFLDLTGIHRHVGGKIDFVNGKVYYYAMDSYINGAIEDTPYFTMTFADILMNHGGIAEADLGKYLKKDSSGNYTTFLDYSTHTFNFYYTERGSGSSVCRINFNFPMLRKNSLTVTKENVNVNSDGSASATQPLGNPDYYFNIVTTDNALFVGPDSVTGVQNYKVMDSAGNILKNADGTDKVFSTDQYGIFTLKAGQSAVFEGINENAGQFYVQELIKAADNDQYHSVRINVTADTTYGGASYPAGSMAPTRYNKLVDWQYRKYFSGVETPNEATPDYNGPYGYQWYGRSGYDTNASSNASFYFEQQNNVDVSNLGQLSITKKLNALDGNVPDTVFRMKVALDGALLPVGTAYTVAGSTKTVTQAGYIEIKAGQTATISNILSGTKFTVEEDEASRNGYQVTLEANDADDVTLENDSISGIVRAKTTVALTVTNSDGTFVTIPGTKTVANPDGSERDFTFRLVEVTDANGGTTTGDAVTQTISVTDTGDFSFRIPYPNGSITEFPATRYYRITEDNDTPGVLKNDTVYIAEVEITGTQNNMTATLKRMQVGTMVEGTPADLVDISDLSADFTNTLVSDLVISKTVTGRESDQAFTFTLTIGTTGQNFTAEKSNGTSLVITGGTATDFTLTHGQTLTVQNVPLGTAWQVTEAPADNYLTSWTQTTGGAIASGGTADTSGTIVAGDNRVDYTNAWLYVLPETGSTGTTSYAMAGLMLMLCSAAYLLYRLKKRGREVI